MSQQGMTIISALIKGGKLSDIEFLSIKEFDGKRVDADAKVTITTSTIADLVKQTANAGKDMYLGSASINGSSTVLASNSNLEYNLILNGVTLETFRVEDRSAGSEWQYPFKTKGLKVLATQIIKITVKQSGTNTIISNGKLELFEEDTGTTPQIPAI